MWSTDVETRPRVLGFACACAHVHRALLGPGRPSAVVSRAASSLLSRVSLGGHAALTTLTSPPSLTCFLLSEPDRICSKHTCYCSVNVLFPDGKSKIKIPRSCPSPLTTHLGPELLK